MACAQNAEFRALIRLAQETLTAGNPAAILDNSDNTILFNRFKAFYRQNETGRWAQWRCCNEMRVNHFVFHFRQRQLVRHTRWNIYSLLDSQKAVYVKLATSPRLVMLTCHWIKQTSKFVLFLFGLAGKCGSKYETRGFTFLSLPCSRVTQEWVIHLGDKLRNRQTLKGHTLLSSCWVFTLVNSLCGSELIKKELSEGELVFNSSCMSFSLQGFSPCWTDHKATIWSEEEGRAKEREREREMFGERHQRV